MASFCANTFSKSVADFVIDHTGIPVDDLLVQNGTNDGRGSSQSYSWAPRLTDGPAGRAGCCTGY